MKTNNLTIIILIGLISIAIGSATYVINEIITEPKEVVALKQPDKIVCVKPLHFPENSGSCFEVLGYQVDEDRWRWEEIRSTDGLTVLFTNTDQFPSPEELCEEHQIDLGTKDCMSYLILRELRK